MFSDEGKVVATGDESLLNEHPDAIRIDGNGHTLLPGLTDGHAHLYNYGYLQQSLNLVGTPSLTESLLKIAAYAEQNPHARWIEGRGWNQVIWPIKEFPAAADIDAVVSDRPVILDRIDGHAVWVNSKAMEIASITDDTPDPVGGKIVRDGDTYRFDV